MSKPKRHFRLSEVSGDWKDLFVTCDSADRFVLTVDNDDVDGYEVACLTRKLIRVLNDHWDDKEYASMNPEPRPEIKEDDYEASDAEYERRTELSEQIIERLLKQKWEVT